MLPINFTIELTIFNLRDMDNLWIPDNWQRGAPKTVQKSLQEQTEIETAGDIIG